VEVERMEAMVTPKERYAAVILKVKMHYYMEMHPSWLNIGRLKRSNNSFTGNFFTCTQM
jgi:hypothetical protein